MLIITKFTWSQWNKVWKNLFPKNKGRSERWQVIDEKYNTKIFDILDVKILEKNEAIIGNNKTYMKLVFVINRGMY